MAIKIAVLVLFAITVIGARPSENNSQKKDVSETGTDHPLKISTSTAEETTELNIIKVEDKIKREAFKTRKNTFYSRYNGETEKRATKQKRDLETAAGTNVLRPLFVYRQQVAYRQRVKKNNQRNS